MATSLRLPPELEADLKQLAEAHERSIHGEMLYALKCYVAEQKQQEQTIEKVVGFWLAEMRGGSEELTAQRIYDAIQANSSHPAKKIITIEDCAEHLRRWQEHDE